MIKYIGLWTFSSLKLILEFGINELNFEEKKANRL